MRRRDFITLIGGGVAAWPLAARAQKPGPTRRVAVLMNDKPTEPQFQSDVDIFIKTLQTLGWRDGQNLRLDIRWSAGDPELIRFYAKELVEIAPDLIVSSSTANLTALLEVSHKIPIVFLLVSDPVAQGFVSNLAHPGGNITGFSAFEFSMGGKWLDLLKQMAPGVVRIGVMSNPDTSPQSKLFLRSIEAAAPGFGVQAMAAPVHDTAEIETIMAGLAHEPNGGLLLPTDTFTNIHSDQIIALAARYGLPAIYSYRTVVRKGGLMSYAIDYEPQFRQAAIYANNILKGANPGEMPIQLATDFKLTLNLKTARALGIEVPMGVMMRADEMIE